MSSRPQRNTARGNRPGHGRQERAENFSLAFRQLLSLFKPWKWHLFFCIIGSFIWAAITVATPLVLGAITNTIFEGAFSSRLPAGLSQAEALEYLRANGNETLAKMGSAMHLRPGEGIDFHRLGWLAVVIVGMYFAANLIDFYVAYTMNRVVVISMYNLRTRVENKIHTLPLSFFDKNKRGDLISRVTNDVDNITQSLQQTLGGLITSITWTIGLIIMMFATSWKLALVGMTVLPFMVITVAIVGPRSQRAYTAQWEETGKVNARVEESFSAHALVKTYGQEQAQIEAFAKENQALYAASLRARILGGLMQPLMNLGGMLSYVGIAVVGGLQVAHGQLTLGTVQAFIQFSQQLNQPIGRLSQSITVVQSAAASTERVFAILEAEDEQRTPKGAPHLEEGPGHVRFENVDFSYTPDKPLIEGLNLEARPGHTVAIVGPTGAGKTTLVNLLMRFYEINAGTIYLDGQDISKVSRRELRSRIGMVLQDPWLFNGTIRENIRYGNQAASDEDVIAAAKASYVDRFVASLPEGYDTVLEENAANVSAGERQLITIARAFISQPSLLILDEATSNVDTRTEAMLQKAMAALREGRTSFVIAHRLSTIRDADLIVVMENGSIVEQGNHNELIRARGAYWRLYQAQFEGRDAEETSDFGNED